MIKVSKSVLWSAPLWVITMAAGAAVNAGDVQGASAVVPVSATGRMLLSLDDTPGASPRAGYWAALRSNPAYIQVSSVKVVPDVIDARTQQIRLPLPGGDIVSFTFMQADEPMPGVTGWVGDIRSAKRPEPIGTEASGDAAMNPFNYASIIREGDKVFGDFRVAGKAYRLEYVAPGEHALIQVDEFKLPPDGPPINVPLEQAQAQSRSDEKRATRSTIRVLLVTSRQRMASTPNAHQQLILALQNANLYLSNSGIPITLQLTGIYDADYDEVGRTYAQTLSDVRNPDSEVGKRVYKVREAQRADLVSMYIAKGDYCGMAYSPATLSNGYSVISCPSALAHELGHNLGSGHEGKPGDNYNRGYRHSTTPVFHTQMVTSHGAVPYFSNPRKIYDGVPMGDYKYADNWRRFNERREIVEHFYPAPDYLSLINRSRSTKNQTACLQPKTGGAPQFATCEAESEQSPDPSIRWSFTRVGDYHQIRNEATGDSQCLVIIEGGNSVRMAPCADNDDQLWRVVPSPQSPDDYTIENKRYDACLSAFEFSSSVVALRCLDAGHYSPWDKWTSELFPLPSQ